MYTTVMCGRCYTTMAEQDFALRVGGLWPGVVGGGRLRCGKMNLLTFD